MNEWIKVEDRLPELDSIVLALGICDIRYSERVREIRQCMYTYWDYTDKGGSKGSAFQLLTSGCGCCDSCLEEVTHWMALPKSPEE